MEIDHIDVHEMENQRYKLIKKKGEYIEFNVLIGTENEEFGEDTVGKMPVVSTTMKKIGPQEVACLYATLKAYLDDMRQTYPAECLLGELAMSPHSTGHTLTYEDEKEENKGEKNEN